MRKPIRPALISRPWSVSSFCSLSSISSCVIAALVAVGRALDRLLIEHVLQMPCEIERVSIAEHHLRDGLVVRVEQDDMRTAVRVLAPAHSEMVCARQVA